DRGEIQRIVDMALAEDVGRGDLTSRATIPGDARLRAVMAAREPLTPAGLPVAEAIFRACDRDCVFAPLSADGDAVAPGGTIARVTGNARALLTAARAA